VLLPIISRRITVLIPAVILRSYAIFKQRSFCETLTTVTQFMILDMQNIYDTGCCGILTYISVENLIKFEKRGHTRILSHMYTLTIS
jgi:hypothetical protein